MTQPYRVGEHILNAIPPELPVTATKTYQIVAPSATHWRKATCADVDCPNYLHGWRVRVEGLPPELVHTARNAGRHYTELAVAEGETWLVFDAGQPCFEASVHRARVDRPELYVVRDGDFRGNPTGRVQRLPGPTPWVDDFGEHQERLAAKQNQG